MHGNATWCKMGITQHTTDDGRVKAISQILYGQYHIWDLYVLGLKTKGFLWEKQPDTLSHGQGTHSAKKSADSLSENTPNASKHSAQFVCPSPKV